MNSSGSVSESELFEKLKNLESRLSRIEKQLKIAHEDEIFTPPEENEDPIDLKSGSESLELQIGEFWLAKSGIVILAIGIAFLLTFPYQNLPAVLPALFGYILVTCHLVTGICMAQFI